MNEEPALPRALTMPAIAALFVWAYAVVSKRIGYGWGAAYITAHPVAYWVIACGGNLAALVIVGATTWKKRERKTKDYAWLGLLVAAQYFYLALVIQEWGS